MDQASLEDGAPQVFRQKMQGHLDGRERDVWVAVKKECSGEDLTLEPESRPNKGPWKEAQKFTFSE